MLEQVDRSKSFAIFNSKLDCILFFIMPVLVTFLYSGWHGVFQIKFLSFELFLRFTLDSPHFFSTIFPLLSRVRKKAFSLWIVLLIPITGVIFVAGLLYFFSAYVNIVFLLLSIAHVVRQQQGWYNILEKQSNTVNSWGSLAIVLAVLGPVMVYFISPNVSSQVSLPFLSIKSTIKISMLSAQAWSLLIFLACYCKALSRSLTRTQSYVIVSTFIWFYMAFAILQDVLFYVVSVIVFHSLPYLLYCWKNNVSQKNIFRTKGWIFWGSIYSTGAVFSFVYAIKMEANSSSSILSGFIFFIIFTHYLYDTFIWRRRFGHMISSL